jgi:hypothetical protein
MRKSMFAVALAVALSWAPQAAWACGGFFCSQTPVDQNAERIIFGVNANGTTDMIVQISFQGRAEDFAWVLPLADVPNVEDLDVFPQLALTSLDAQTGPTFQWPDMCYGLYPPQAGGVDDSAGDGDGDSGVDVHLRAEVGPYDVVVISGADPEAVAKWLRDNDFRIADAMDPYIALYVHEGLKFLALKLQKEKDVLDISPFKLTLKGESPSIPLRITGIAAEPEMGIVAWVFADQRFGPGGEAKELVIDDADLRWDPQSWLPTTNWSALVARAVDTVNGKGWVVEQAAPVDALRQAVMDTFVADDMQTAARDALLGMLEGKAYMTRFYTRLSPEEMTFDPVFKRSAAGDVSRDHKLPYLEEYCNPDGGVQPSPSPCDFAACGALGLCRDVPDENGATVAACACAPGATARTTFDATPDGQLRTTVACQDKRMSFLNPGDKSSGAILPDPCVGVSCGAHGGCIAVNMTPTCECDQGYVARGWLEGDGVRRGECVEPSVAIPDSFYNRRPPERDPSLPVGRPTDLSMPSGPSDADDPFPQGNQDMRAKIGSKGCSFTPGGEYAGWLGGAGFLLALAAVLRRKRH